MRIAALDLSSKTGVAFWQPGLGRPQAFTKKVVGWDYDIHSMLRLWRLYLVDFYKTFQPEIVAIERWFLPDHMDGNTVFKQLNLSGFTQWALGECGCKIILPTAGQWRSHVYGSSRNNGTNWKVRATQKADFLGWEYDDHNSAEAALILDYAIVTVAKLNPPWRDDMLMARAA